MPIRSFAPAELDRSQLAESWRARADELDRQARRHRSAGDPRYAEEHEQAATDYRQAADELELGRELLNPGGFEPRREAGYCRECRTLVTFTEGKCDYCASPAPNTTSRDVPAADIDAALRFRVERPS